MSTITREFTKEQLIEHLKKQMKQRELHIASPATDRGFREYLELEIATNEIALASLEAEAVVYMWDSERKDIDAPGYYRPEHLVFAESSVKQWGGRIVPLYTAPPAPVVPDLKELEAILDWILLLPCPTPKATHMAKRLAVVIDACRAAMLQGAEPVTTAYKLPEGWVACSERMPEDRESVLLWDIDLDDACSGHYSHETGNFYQSGMIIDNEITHWMPLPAAPQQEVKNG